MLDEPSKIVILPQHINIDPRSPLGKLTFEDQQKLRVAMATYTTIELNGGDSRSKERLDAISVMRDCYVKSGIGEGLCASHDCMELAEMTVNWPVAVGEQQPRYCKHCGEWAIKILETMGIAGVGTPYQNPVAQLFEAPAGARRIRLDD